MKLNDDGLKSVLIDIRYWETISRLIIDFPEMGYKSVDEFIDNAIFMLLREKGLELGKLQTWMKR